MLRAGIDIGTNTILLLIAEVEGGRVQRVIEDHVRVVRLGQGVDKNRIFHPEAMERARACFRDYSEVLKRYPKIEIRAVATSGSRDAKNSAEFFREIEEAYGIPVRVISGMEEAWMSFAGALSGESRDPERLAVIDIGGGSTEIVGQRNHSKMHLKDCHEPTSTHQKADGLFRFSFDMGCVRLTERFLHSDPPQASEIQKLRAFVKEELAGQQEIVMGLRGKELVGVAGTATYLASSALGLTKFDVDKVQGAELTLEAVVSLEKRFSTLKSAERLGIGGMDKGRADVIVAGCIILEETMRAAGFSHLSASVRGLRFGAVLAEPFID
jgi:exopolyphosphatase / guanosine-5'-triphosphate,3'-diphosphate pyrophosphatase